MAAARTDIAGMKVAVRCFKTDPNLWWVLGTDSQDQEIKLGIVAWYIDDALILAERAHAPAITEFIAGLWNTTPPEYLVPGQVLVYNGFEIEQDGDCIRLHQKSFLTELLNRYPGTEQSDVPAVATSPSEEESADVALTRRCQALCGELLWLTIRTQPELCYAVNMTLNEWPVAAGSMATWTSGSALLATPFTGIWSAQNQSSGMRYSN